MIAIGKLRSAALVALLGCGVTTVMACVSSWVSGPVCGNPQQPNINNDCVEIDCPHSSSCMGPSTDYYCSVSQVQTDCYKYQWVLAWDSNGVLFCDYPEEYVGPITTACYQVQYEVVGCH